MAAMWMPDAVVRLDFSSTALPADADGFHVASPTHAKVGSLCELTPGSRMICEFVLSSAPDDKHSFGFIARGGGAPVQPPALSCDAVGGGAAAAGGGGQGAAAGTGTGGGQSPPGSAGGGAAPEGSTRGGAPSVQTSGLAGDDDDSIDPAALERCAMGVTVSIQNSWASGYRAAVRVRRWAPSAKLTVDFGAGVEVELLNTYGATTAAQKGGSSRPPSGPGGKGQRVIEFTLGPRPDRDYAGFGFTARGAPFAPEAAEVRCPTVTAEMLVPPPPPPDCALGASFKYLDTWRTGFEAEVAVERWRAGARFTLDFTPSGSPPLLVLNSWHAAAEAPPDADRPSGRQLAANKAKGGHADAATSARQGSASLTASRVISLVLLPEASASFRITARFAEASPGELDASHAVLRAPILSCTSGGLPPPPPPRPAHRGGNTNVPPDPPVAPRVLRASCASITLAWDGGGGGGGGDGGGGGGGGGGVLEYRVWASRGSLPRAVVREGLSAPQAELTGMLASTTYSFVVQARNAAGWSGYSAEAHGSTEAALRSPATPYQAPTPSDEAAAAAKLTSSGHAETAGGGRASGDATGSLPACALGVRLSLPALRGGCSGDEYANVEVQRLGGDGDAGGAAEAGWSVVASRVLGDDVFIDEGALRLVAGKDTRPIAAAAYRFRTVAHNGKGASPPGPATEPLLTHHALSAAVRAPLVVATGPTTLRIGADERIGDLTGGAGGAMPCDLSRRMRFEVLLRHEHSSEWRTLVELPEAGTGLPVEVGGATCHHGCYLKVRALNISGWEGYSRPSELVTTPLPPTEPALGAARIELRLVESLPPPIDRSAREWVDRLVESARLPKGQMTVVTTRTSTGAAHGAAHGAAAGLVQPSASSSTFLTLEVAPPGAAAAWDGDGPSSPRAPKVSGLDVDLYLKELVAHPALLGRLSPPVDPRFGIRKQPHPADYDPSDPLSSLSSTQLLAGAAASVRGFSDDEGSTEFRARRITFAILACVAAVACCWPVCSSIVEQLREMMAGGEAAGAPFGSRGGTRHAPLAQDVDELDEQDNGHGFGEHDDPHIDGGPRAYRKDSKDQDETDEDA